MDWNLQTVVEKRCHVKALFSLNMYGGREGQKLRRLAKLHKNNLTNYIDLQNYTKIIL